MRRRLLLLLSLAVAFVLASCAPIQTAAAPYALVLVRDGADLVIPNPGGPLVDGWQLSVDATPDYKADAQGAAWCPVQQVLDSPKYGKFIRLHCTMPVLFGGFQRQVVTVSGRVLAAQGFAYRDATKAVPISSALP